MRDPIPRGANVSPARHFTPPRAAFPHVPSAQDFLRCMVRVGDGRLVFALSGGAPRGPIEREQIGQVRGVFAQRVIGRDAPDPFFPIKVLGRYSGPPPRTTPAFIYLPPTDALPC